MFSTISSPHLPGTYRGPKNHKPSTVYVTHPSEFSQNPPGVKDDDVFGPKAHQILKIFSLVPPTWSAWSCRRISVRGNGKVGGFIFMLGKKPSPYPPKSWDFSKGEDLGSPWRLEFWASFLFGNLSPPELKQVSPACDTACVFIMTFCRANVGNGQSFVPFLGWLSDPFKG